MDNETLKLDEQNEQNVSEMDLKRANIIAQTFVEKVESTAPVRIGTTQDEKESALKIRQLFHKILGLPSRMEPFTARPLAGRFGIPVFGAVYALALLFYILGILVQIEGYYVFLTISMMILLVDSVIFIVQVYMDKNVFNFIFPKRTSYNVFSTIESKANVEYTLILGGHYDCDMDRADIFMFFRDKNLPKWLSKTLKALSLLSVPVLFVFSIVAISVPQKDTGLIAFLFLFPTIFCGLAIFYLVTYFSYKKRNSNLGHEGLQGAGLTLAVADYLRLHPEVVPDNCRIILANFGSKECGAKGSEQMILQHYGKDDLMVNPVLLNFEKVGINSNTVFQGDKQFKTSYDLKICNIAYNTLKELGLQPEFAYNKSMFTDASPFARRKIPATTLSLKIGDNEISNAYNEAFQGAIKVTVNIMNYLRERQEQYKGTIKDDLEQI